jgi:hypothetical protein
MISFWGRYYAAGGIGMNSFDIEMAFECNDPQKYQVFFEAVQIAILDTNNSEQLKYSKICAAYRAAMSGMAKRLDELEESNMVQSRKQKTGAC